MKETTLEAAIQIGESAQIAGKRWHFHILAPACRFNPKPGTYALVVELTSDSETYVTYQDERPAEAGKKLLGLLHGSKVLQGTGESSHVANRTTATIVERAKGLNERNIHWHHDMMFPTCVINPSPGRWNLTFEDPETGETLSALYDSEPVQDLKEVEALFYAQSK